MTKSERAALREFSPILAGEPSPYQLDVFKMLLAAGIGRDDLVREEQQIETLSEDFGYRYANLPLDYGVDKNYAMGTLPGGIYNITSGRTKPSISRQVLLDLLIDTESLCGPGAVQDFVCPQVLLSDLQEKVVASAWNSFHPKKDLALMLCMSEEAFRQRLAEKEKNRGLHLNQMRLMQIADFALDFYENADDRRRFIRAWHTAAKEESKSPGFDHAAFAELMQVLPYEWMVDKAWLIGVYATDVSKIITGKKPLSVIDRVLCRMLLHTAPIIGDMLYPVPRLGDVLHICNRSFPTINHNSISFLLSQTYQHTMMRINAENCSRDFAPMEAPRARVLQLVDYVLDEALRGDGRQDVASKRKREDFIIRWIHHVVDAKRDRGVLKEELGIVGKEAVCS